jgi:hypothetical protein
VYVPVEVLDPTDLRPAQVHRDERRLHDVVRLMQVTAEQEGRAP